jgi:hypothetical protein
MQVGDAVEDASIDWDTRGDDARDAKCSSRAQPECSSQSDGVEQ